MLTQVVFHRAAVRRSLLLTTAVCLRCHTKHFPRCHSVTPNTQLSLFNLTEAWAVSNITLTRNITWPSWVGFYCNALQCSHLVGFPAGSGSLASNLVNLGKQYKTKMAGGSAKDNYCQSGVLTCYVGEKLSVTGRQASPALQWEDSGCFSFCVFAELLIPMFGVNSKI